MELKEPVPLTWERIEKDLTRCGISCIMTVGQ